MLFDSHCHLTDQRLAPEIDAILEAAHKAGVTEMTTIGAEPAVFHEAIRLAHEYEGVYATIGVHPHIADQTDRGVLDQIAELVQEDRVVAIGETGLDYYYDNAPRATQRRSFSEHLELAAELGLPLIVHSRSADDDTIAVLRDAEGAGVRGILHCFDGGAELLDAGLEAGWFISFAGIVTFHNYTKADLVRATPDERLLIETDSPYLAPVPERGKRNEPAFLRHTAQVIAEIRGAKFEEIAELTTSNAHEIYGIGG